MTDYMEMTNDDLDESNIEEEEEESEELEEDETQTQTNTLASLQHKIISKEEVYQKLYNDVNKTTHMLTKYERAKIIGIRAQMIADQGVTLVDTGDLTDPVEMAKAELKANKIPLLIRRQLPGKNPKKPLYEIRRVSDLQKKV